MLFTLFMLAACNNIDKEAIATEDTGVVTVDWTEEQIAPVEKRISAVENKTSEIEREISALQATLKEMNEIIFKDVTKGYWAYDDVMSLYEKEIIKGYPEEKMFYPEKTITRYQAASMLIKAFNIEPSNTPSVFNDVGDDHWAVKEVMAAYEAGFFIGSEGNFMPQEPMKRRHMAIVLQRAFELEELEDAEFTGYEDVPETLSGYEAIKIISQHGIAQGSDGLFNPEASTKRSQFSAFIERAIASQNNNAN